MKKTDVKAAVLEAAEEVLGLPQDEMEGDMDLALFENGLIDSMGCVAMMAYIEETLGISIPVENMQTEEFTSLNTICNAVAAMM